jgi:hypothetical protein
MRYAINPQLQIGETLVSDIQFDIHSREDIPQLLRGLQHIYNDTKARDLILEQLGSVIIAETDPDTGRPGMSLWSILVLGVLRLGLNCDYDRVMELANEHRTLRQMLGHGLFDEDKRYGLQTIKDNVTQLSSEILTSINHEIVKQGHQILGQENPILLGRCDSFVVETDVDFPTDVKLLVDAMRKLLVACGKADKTVNEIKGWRQWTHLYNGLRNLGHKASKLKKSNSTKPEQVEKREKLINQNYRRLLDQSHLLLGREVQQTYKGLQTDPSPSAIVLIETIKHYLPHAERQLDQINRRILLDEVIPHEEKVFSIFEEHTEWISKGKAGVPVELGLRVCVLEDQMGFLLYHKVMEKQTDDKVAVAMIEETQVNYPLLKGCSFDKGFHSKSNQEALQKLLDQLALPKKGKWSKADKERESTEAFVAARKQHPAIESAINALEVHGLDRCPDRGIDGFKRYVAWAIVSRNLIKVGAILQQKEREQFQRVQRRERQQAA